uniref:Putative methyltransferase n=1 Tax=viral metagenome TaxID=1070528 RepID=A0A6M3ISA2_9ZZZZ
MHKRAEFWNNNYTTAQQSDSIAVPFAKYLDRFTDKRVLEIGPGEGRQFDAVVGLVKDYAVADISQKVLSHYLCSVGEYLITSYKDRFDVRFDLIHFWYVLHHVRRNEIDLFVDFLYDHLTRAGLILFNTPQLDPARKDYGGNGIETTWFDLVDIKNALFPKFAIIDIEDINDKGTGYMILAGKKLKIKEVEK